MENEKNNDIVHQDLKTGFKVDVRTADRSMDTLRQTLHWAAQQRQAQTSVTVTEAIERFRQKWSPEKVIVWSDGFKFKTRTVDRIPQWESCDFCGLEYDYAKNIELTCSNKCAEDLDLFLEDEEFSGMYDFIIDENDVELTPMEFVGIMQEIVLPAAMKYKGKDFEDAVISGLRTILYERHGVTIVTEEDIARKLLEEVRQVKEAPGVTTTLHKVDTIIDELMTIRHMIFVAEINETLHAEIVEGICFLLSLSERLRKASTYLDEDGFLAVDEDEQISCEL